MLMLTGKIIVTLIVILCISITIVNIYAFGMICQERDDIQPGYKVGTYIYFIVILLGLVHLVPMWT